MDVLLLPLLLAWDEDTLESMALYWGMSDPVEVGSGTQHKFAGKFGGKFTGKV